MYISIITDTCGSINESFALWYLGLLCVTLYLIQDNHGLGCPDPLHNYFPTSCKVITVTRLVGRISFFTSVCPLVFTIIIKMKQTLKYLFILKVIESNLIEIRL